MPLSLDSLFLRPMNSVDLVEVLKIEQAAQASPWARLSFEESMTREDFCRVVEFDKQIVAYHICSNVLDELHLLNVVCAVPMQGQGLGHFLMNDIMACAKLSNAKKVFLEVRAGNKVAQSLYEKWGFEEIALRKKYYRASKPQGAREDAKVYCKHCSQVDS